MASRNAINARRSDAQRRIDTAIGTISRRLGVEIPEPTVPAAVNRDAELREANRMETTAGTLEAIAGAIDSALADPSDDTEPLDNMDAVGGPDDEMHFGYPESQLRPLTRNEMIALDGISEKRADKLLEIFGRESEIPK